MGSIPGWGTKILRATQHGLKSNAGSGATATTVVLTTNNTAARDSPDNRFLHSLEKKKKALAMSQKVPLPTRCIICLQASLAMSRKWS